MKWLILRKTHYTRIGRSNQFCSILRVVCSTTVNCMYLNRPLRRAMVVPGYLLCHPPVCACIHNMLFSVPCFRSLFFSLVQNIYNCALCSDIVWQCLNICFLEWETVLATVNKIVYMIRDHTSGLTKKKKSIYHLKSSSCIWESADLNSILDFTFSS